MSAPASRTMDFFSHQDHARRHTRWLVFHFVLAVIFITLSVYLAVVLIFFGFKAQTDSTLALNPWSLEFFLWVAAATLAVIIIGSLYKIVVLSGGGEVVARGLGGRPVDPSTANFKERQLLNVVEEMAIASGMPVPSVFLLEKEDGINAFAAGFTPTDAVIGVTRGTIEMLSRDELQGVIAHEFSHIFNGDMRLNIRLMGVLNGILVIALIGYTILRGTRVSSREKGGGAAVLLFGGTLLVIGYVGVFFGRLIKSAVSRQREFLADASAVQFTRNPGGIAGALKRIGGQVYGSGIQSPKAEEASHLFFANGLLRAKLTSTSPLALNKSHRVSRASQSHSSLLATHPPLDERIRRIDPSFDGTFPEVRIPAKEVIAERGLRKRRLEEEKSFAVVPQQMTENIGKLTEAHLAYAVALLSGLPTQLRDEVHEPSGARAVVFALLLNRDAETRRAQFKLLSESRDPLISQQTLEASSHVERCPPQARLPLIDLALPTLRRLSPAQYQEFRALVERMIKADEKIDLFELTLRHILGRHLDRYFLKTSAPTVQYYSLISLAAETSLLLSSLAHAGHEEEAVAKQAFAKGADELAESKVKLSFRTRQECSLKGITESLDKLALVSPNLKRQLLRGCATSVSHDQQVTIHEGELLRAIADSLDCPMPPFIAGQSL